MTTRTIKSAALAIAASGLVLAVPASAVPAPHSAAYGHSAVWSDAKQEQYRSYRNYPTYGSGGYAQQGYYGEPVYANTRVWQGEDGRYYCRKSNGTTGLVIGAAGGALLGRMAVGRNGDRTLGAILGAAGGALLGRQIERNSSTRCR